MTISITNQYLLLSISKGEYPDAIMNTEIIVSLVTLGLYELQKNNIIEICNGNDDTSFKIANENATITIKNELPDNLGYLAHLYNAICDIEKKTLLGLFRKIMLDIKGEYYDKFSTDLINECISKNLMQKEVKSGLFGIKRNKYTVDENVTSEIIKKLKDEILKDNVTDKEMLILVKLIIRSCLIYELYNKEEYKLIKNRVKELEEQLNSTVANTLVFVDKLYVFCLAFITATRI